jgi:hypothetical protein
VHAGPLVSGDWQGDDGGGFHCPGIDTGSRMIKDLLVPRGKMKLLLTSFLDHIRRLVSNREKPGGSYSVEDYILNLQRVGRLLLRFLARRSDVVVR